jgi:hypothetical protein
VKIVVAIVVGLMLAGAACGQDSTSRESSSRESLAQQLPDAPQPKVVAAPVDHGFLNQGSVSVFLASAVTITTEAGMSCGQYTSGPALPSKTCKQIAAGAALTLAIEILASAVLHKTGHHRVEWLGPLFADGFHVGRMAWISTR